jgi:hypothetical protein
LATAGRQAAGTPTPVTSATITLRMGILSCLRERTLHVLLFSVSRGPPACTSMQRRQTFGVGRHQPQAGSHLTDALSGNTPIVDDLGPIAQRWGAPSGFRGRSLVVGTGGYRGRMLPSCWRWSTGSPRARPTAGRRRGRRDRDGVWSADSVLAQ